MADLAGCPHQGCLLHTSFLSTTCLLLPALGASASCSHQSHFCSLLLPSHTQCLFVSAHLAASYAHLLPLLLSCTSLAIRQESSNASVENGDVEVKKFPNMIKRMSTTAVRIVWVVHVPTGQRVRMIQTFGRGNRSAAQLCVWGPGLAGVGGSIFPVAALKLWS